MKWLREVVPVSVEPLRILRIGALQVTENAAYATADGKRLAMKSGCWMFYMPALQAKLFHACDGMIDCVHNSRPDATVLLQQGLALGRYSSDDWRRALSTPLHRRLAEVWLVSARLWRAGLGPQPLGICRVNRLCRDGYEKGPTCGLLTQNVFQLPRKLACRLGHIYAAGVVPDRIESCVRQQIRGYVTDLCSVVGCMPSDAEPAIESLVHAFDEDLEDSRLLACLSETLR